MGIEDFPWVGGRPSLDLCNTAVACGEVLDDGSALLEWLNLAGCSRSTQVPNTSDLARIRHLRDSLREGFIKRDAVAVSEIAEKWLSDTPGRLHVDLTTMEPVFRADPETLGCLTTPILLDALSIVRDGLKRVRLCASESCSMLYIDSSRNGSRRWCSMDRCGSRAKAHAYYERKRAERGV